MNYRHAYHAGNFADVVKHIVLARVITYLKIKPQPFRVIDTHAGAGLYDLDGDEASRTGEWRDGIARLARTALSPPAAELLADYLGIVADFNPHWPASIDRYPGSPILARRLMRRDDVLVANELHPEEHRQLAKVLRRGATTKLLQLDAWQVVKSSLPPKERRGLVVIDPPFEKRDEFEAIEGALSEAMRRFANGIYMIWYPVKDEARADLFCAAASELAGRPSLDIRLRVSSPFPGLGLVESGVLVIAPPYTLEAELAVVLPELSAVLAEGKGAGFSLKAGGAESAATR